MHRKDDEDSVRTFSQKAAPSLYVKKTRASSVMKIAVVAGVGKRSLNLVMLLRLCFVLGLFVVGLISLTTAAGAYSCGNPSAGHCYGIASWQEQPEYFGAYSDITQSAMTCNPLCFGSVDNEVWLIDDASPECRANSFQMCWVEAGYVEFALWNSPGFFWADVRPTNQSTFNLHILGPSDPVGTTDHFMIVKDGRTSPQSFLVFLYNDSQSTLYGGASTITSGNPMRAVRLEIGQELAGPGGASADLASFMRNIWAVQPLGSEYVFWYAPQTTPGNVQSDNPPFGQWSVNPGTPPIEGGKFTTRCCS